MSADGSKLVAVIGDEDTVTGFILAGVGHRTAEGTNFLVVKSCMEIAGSILHWVQRGMRMTV
jgi:vacuolar-type H+-ATPase subunit F/Vma7